MQAKGGVNNSLDVICDPSAHSAVVFSRQFGPSVLLRSATVDRNGPRNAPLNSRTSDLYHPDRRTERRGARSLAQGERERAIMIDCAIVGKMRKESVRSRLGWPVIAIMCVAAGTRRFGFLPMALPNFFQSDIRQVFSPAPPRKHFISATHLSSLHGRLCRPTDRPYSGVEN